MSSGKRDGSRASSQAKGGDSVLGKLPKPPYVDARLAAAVSIAHAVTKYPNLPPSTLHTGGLPSVDAGLATAIHRTTLQRWITLEFLLSRYLKKPIGTLEPTLRAVLLTGGAQIVFMSRIPSYAVVDSSVTLARKLVRPKAAGLVNAVLRRLAELVTAHEPELVWKPATNALPNDGGTVVLAEPILPDPVDLIQHLSVVTSHPRRLPRRWLDQLGPTDAMAICLHNTITPPTIVSVEPAFKLEELDEQYLPHQLPGFLVWTGSHHELKTFLAGHPRRRVQDPASVQALLSVADLPINSVIDFCAGRGTKTRQLANLFSQARITATEIDDHRRADLIEVADEFVNVTAMHPSDLPRDEVDLLLLDVPCSNTGVLARRPEARYRLNDQSIEDLTTLQHEIITELFGHVKDGGYILYTTCSLEPEENQQQTQYILDTTGGELIHQMQIYPSTLRSQLPLKSLYVSPHQWPTVRDAQARYHDGSYHALIQIP
ncbi:transcription antitermination factor NusB [Poriferisphaera sp. WC338]|uniref:transcription antitermination factor NusB n=1 Tax=Poriferisphaera sp. WC338 TaxID=3425129 RepID=UPI003D8169A6